MAQMHATGRYHTRLPNGRTFTIEPIDERVNRSKEWGQNEGLVKPMGGAVRTEDSVITEANGYHNIQIVQNPMDVIDRALRE